MSLTTYFLYFIIFKELFTRKKLMTTAILLFVLPFLWKPIITWFFPVKVYMPPPEPVCPSKPSVKVPPPPVQPAPSKKSSWKPEYFVPRYIADVSRYFKYNGISRKYI